MYREQPSKNFSDSGWRFFAGNEKKEYCDEPSNFSIYNLSTIIEIDNKIVELLDAPIGSKFELNKKNQFVEVK